MTSEPVAADFTRLARVFHALSDPIRLQVVDLLRGGERCVCELTETLELAQSRLSFHLRALKDAGVVLDRRDGRWVHYRLNPERVTEVAGLLSDCCQTGRRWLTPGCCK